LVVVEVAAVATIVFVVAALAVGRFDRMSEAPADAPFVEPLPSGPASSADVRAVRFAMALRGYRMAEVDAVLARLADELAWRDEEIARRDAEIVKLAEFARIGQPMAYLPAEGGDSPADGPAGAESGERGPADAPGNPGEDPLSVP
jgi:DivIVA domain-containing protein